MFSSASIPIPFPLSFATSTLAQLATTKAMGSKFVQLGEDAPGAVLASMLQQIEGKGDFADLVAAGKFVDLQNAFIASMDKVRMIVALHLGFVLMRHLP